MMKPSTKHQALSTLLGFSLIELSVVLAIIAVVMGSVIALTSATLEGKSANNSMAKLKFLQQALADYRIANNRLPCPALSSLATSSPSFGVEVATTTPCTGAESASALVAIGLVPVRTLGLPDDMAIDSWGRRIRYAVVPAFANINGFSAIQSFSGDGATTAFTLTVDPVSASNITVSIGDALQPTSSYSVSGTTLTFTTAPATGTNNITIASPATDTTPRLTINNNDNNDGSTPTNTPHISTTALFVLVSYGKDGHGAYTGNLNGTSASTIISTGITNNNTLLNCKCTNAGVANFATAANNAIFVQGEAKAVTPSSPLTNFDDLVVFSTRAGLRNATE